MTALLPKVQKAILLIDDDELIAGSLRQVLASGGCDVDVALDPGTARALMESRAYDVVLVDPYLTGGVHQSGELLEDIKTLQQGASVVVLTGYGSPDLVRAAADGRVSKILSKPQSIPFLSETLFSASQIAVIEPSIKGRPE